MFRAQKTLFLYRPKRSRSSASRAVNPCTARTATRSQFVSAAHVACLAFDSPFSTEQIGSLERVEISDDRNRAIMDSRQWARFLRKPA